MKKNKTPKAVIITVLTLITSLSWISFDIYRALMVKPSPSVPQDILEPITPTLDSKVIDEMEQRNYFDENQIPEPPAQQPDLSPSPEATASSESAIPIPLESGPAQ